MAPKKRSIDEITAQYQPEPGLWSASSLAAAGYEWKGDGPCKSCGERVSFYKREKAGDYKGPARWQVVNEGVLDVHRCKGRG